jgi:hypothetical protein
MNNVLETLQKKSKQKHFFSLGSIIVLGLIIRLYYFPNDIPLIIDSLKYFLYASDILALGHLPESWIVINNGWPIFLSFWFKVIPLEGSIQFMELQRMLAITLSSLTAIPVYYLCKKFVESKYAIIGCALFIFDPRLILNSVSGLNEPLYIFLGALSLVLLLKNERKAVLLSFVLASLCTIVRGEGIFFFFAIIIIFLVQNKFTKNSIKTIIPAIGVFFIILIPILINRIEVSGSDGIFIRAAGAAVQTSIETQTNGFNKIFTGFELFVKFLIWVLIPNFILFLPFGVFQYLRKFMKKEKFIIIFLVTMSIPALYAYSVPAQDTRYLYFLFPVFSILSAIAIREYFSRFKKINYLLIVMIFGLILSSVIFYEYKKDDWRMNNEKEIEIISISRDINQFADGVNHHPTLGRYIKALQVPSYWPIPYDEISVKTHLISVKGKTLEGFIEKNKDHLTHIIIDDKSNIPKFLNEINNNGKNYEYLELVYDSKNKGYNQEFKVFKINYDIINLNKDKN